MAADVFYYVNGWERGCNDFGVKNFCSTAISSWVCENELIGSLACVLQAITFCLTRMTRDRKRLRNDHLCLHDYRLPLYDCVYGKGH